MSMHVIPSTSNRSYYAILNKKAGQRDPISLEWLLGGRRSEGTVKIGLK
jgi:hypothetical protein